ncbi:MAG TPA: glyceraldehyde 3-phosphate dehydrogenase NAD-binding domain-containing protein [Syntrophorhabdaceae bacterium]|nr:glyceraldehyde 3-phosphate dehydrogenase NAD-binding domain-containing protein [Syntrophorhabdaceae bacterium]
MSKVEVFENKPPVLGINSLGRIGKLTLWHHVGRKYFNEIVVNVGREVGQGLSTIAQLIEKDSTYGTMHKFLYGIKAQRLIEIVDEKSGKLRIDGIPVTILREARNPIDIGWRNYGVDVVVECTGKFKDPTVPVDDKGGSIKGHLASGAKLVINSSAFKVKNKALSIPAEATTLIYGINHGSFNYKKHQIISAASCTTTGLAHMVKPLLDNEETSKILTASMSTVHAVTNSQSVLDKLPKAGEKDLRKNRSVLNSIILTSTNAAAALAQVIPEVKNIGFMADSIRIPTTTESLIILNVTFQTRIKKDGTKTPLTTKMLNDIYQTTSKNDPENLLIFTMEQNVSNDLIGTDAAIVIEGQFNHTRTAFIDVDLSHVPDLPENVRKAVPEETLKIPVVHAKIFGWYDNEYGSYTNRMADLTVYAHKSLFK